MKRKRLTVWDMPGEIAVPWGNGNSCDDICKEVGGECERCVVNKCFSKLAEYEDAEEEGKLYNLPISIGDHVYCPNFKTMRIADYQVYAISIFASEVNIAVKCIYSAERWETPKQVVPLTKIENGEWFLNLIDAEAKLKEMEADNG